MSFENTENKPSIRQAREEDLNFLERLYFEIRKDEFSCVGWDNSQLETFLKLQFQMQKQAYRMQFPEAVQYIIEFRQISVGRLLIRRNEAETRLIDISLLPDYRRNGLGTYLMEQLKAETSAEKKPLRLRVLKTNAGAKQFYDRLGFTVTDDTDLYFAMQWQNH